MTRNPGFKVTGYLKVEYLADGARAFKPVMEIKPNRVSVLHRHTAYQRKVLATTVDA